MTRSPYAPTSLSTNVLKLPLAHPILGTLFCLVDLVQDAGPAFDILLAWLSFRSNLRATYNSPHIHAPFYTEG